MVGTRSVALVIVALSTMLSCSSAIGVSTTTLQERREFALQQHISQPWPKVDSDWGVLNIALAKLALNGSTNATLAAEISAEVNTPADKP